MIQRAFYPLLALLLAACTTATNVASPDEDLTLVPERYRGVPMVGRMEGIAPPTPVQTPSPEVSRELRQSRIMGASTVEMVIDERGNVTEAWYVSGDAEWARSVLATVRKWKFEPARRDGAPVMVRYRMTSNFNSMRGR